MFRAHFRFQALPYLGAVSYSLSCLLFPLQICTVTNSHLEISMSKINKQNTLNSGYLTVNDLWFFAEQLLLSSSTTPACSKSLLSVLTALAKRTFHKVLLYFSFVLAFLSLPPSVFTVVSSGTPHISTIFRIKREIRLETYFSLKMSLKQQSYFRQPLQSRSLSLVFSVIISY